MDTSKMLKDRPVDDAFITMIDSAKTIFCRRLQVIGSVFEVGIVVQ